MRLKEKIKIIISNDKLLFLASKTYNFMYVTKKKIRGKSNIVKAKLSFIKKGRILINGSYNQVYFGKLVRANNVLIHISGNNNSVIINEACFLSNVELIVEDDNSIIEIGKNTVIYGAHIGLTESNSKIIIGSDCLFSKDIEIRNGDSHSIIDCDSNERINKAKDVVIGNNVWVGAHARILKGSEIPNNCVVANSSIITKKFIQNNCVIAGYPAKVIRENIYWKRERI